jgi:hypothetical protein
MKNNLAGAIIIACVVATGCSTALLTVDPSTYLFHKARVEEQKKAGAAPFVGLYRVAFKSDHVVDRPEQATAVYGDWQVACLTRGPDLDCISLSGYTGYVGGSDQGASYYSVNLQGATLWSFPIKMISASPTSIKGKDTGLLTRDGARPATLSKLDDTALRILVEPSEAQRAAIPKSQQKFLKYEVFFLSPINE